MMVEQEGGGEKFPEASSAYHSYPPPQATYEDVVRYRDLFMDTLKKLHLAMGTKFMIPIVGGRDLDLHRLFVEVTSRGGIAKVLKEKNWKEVTAVFNFPSSATNASFILRKYYISLIYHYEQIYFFKAKCWTPSPMDAIQSLSTVTPPPSAARRAHTSSSAETSAPEVSLASSSGSPVCGVIDGKFDSGYLITVKIGSEEFKGVLYQVPNCEDHPGGMLHTQVKPDKLVKPGVPRRKRRKKSEIRKRDPDHPKPNRSGYNFFFAEQHARLKPHYYGRDREISRIIGESWNKLQEPERSVYQDRALKDKERYKTEMEAYRERLRTGEVAKSAMPMQQLCPPVAEVISAGLNNNAPPEGGEENGLSSDKSDEEGYESGTKDSDYEECSQADMELKNVNIEIMSDEAFDLQQTRVVREDERNLGGGPMDVKDKTLPGNDNLVLVEGGISVHIQEQAPSNGDESVVLEAKF